MIRFTITRIIPNRPKQRSYYAVSSTEEAWRIITRPSAFEQYIALSSNGKSADSESVNLGSSPSGASIN